MLLLLLSMHAVSTGVASSVLYDWITDTDTGTYEGPVVSGSGVGYESVEDPDPVHYEHIPESRQG